jgi:hypothetical protein
MPDTRPATFRSMFSFYVPLMAQAFSQSLTYPLVAAVVVRGSLGASAMSAFAQGQTVMFIIGTLTVGLVTTGMVHARNRSGYRHFCRLNFVLAGAVLILQLLAGLPPFDHLIFKTLLTLDGAYFDAARETLLLGIPAHFGFMWRNPYQVALYNARASGAANAATFGRIALTGLLSLVWCHFFPNGGGVRPATLVFTAPIYLEVLVSWLLARKYIRALTDGEAASFRRQFMFNIPLTLGGFLLSSAAFVIAAFIGRGAEPERMVTLHFIVVGIINPLGFAGLRLQAVLLAFMASDGEAMKRKVWQFAWMVGAALGAVAMLFTTGFVAEWYFGVVQKLSPEDVKLAKFAAFLFSPLPWLQALRGYVEGLAAWRQRPGLIFAGQVAFTVALLVVLTTLLYAGASGYFMGVVALLAASLATQLTIHLGLGKVLSSAIKLPSKKIRRR